MTANERSEKVKNLRELMRMQEELEAEIEAIKDEFKAEMTANNTDEMHGTDYKITWHTVASNKLDTKALKAALPDIAAQYTKTTTTRRFLLA